MENFGFQELKVWQVSVEFANSVLDVIDTKLPDNKHRRLKEQVEAASVSIASNIAEGKTMVTKRVCTFSFYSTRFFI